MEFVQKSGIKIPKLGFGTWMLEGAACVDATLFALKTGYRHIDTAQIYGNEAEVGEAIAESGVARQDIFLTTKIWRDNVSAGKLEESLDESLKKLRTDYVDLLLIHWPVEEVPLSDTIPALKSVQEKGKTKLIGVSNFTVAQMAACVDGLGADLTTNQVEYHPYLSQEAVLDYARAHEMFLTAYSPLGRMKLADATIREIAQKHGKTESQIILRWHIQQPDVVAIPKSATSSHIESNFEIFDFVLTDAEMERITALTKQNKRLINPDFAPKWDAAA